MTNPTMLPRFLLCTAMLTVGCGQGIAPGDAGDAASNDVAPVPPAVPRPVVPSTTAHVSSHRPTLHLVPAADSDGTRVEICRERACTTAIASLDTATDSVRPTDALSPGAYFWRARALRAGVPATATSATWEFFVGPTDASVDTSWGIVPDYDGDGYADLVDAVFDVQHSDWVDLFVYRGGANGLSIDTRVRVHLGIESDILDGPLRTVGDVNGDGYVDLAGVASQQTGSDGLVGMRVYFGGPNGLDPAFFTRFEIAEPAALSLRNADVRYFGGDLDHDGYSDVGWTFRSVGAEREHLEVHRGGPNGVDSAVAIRLDIPDGSGAAINVAGVEDVNGDGRLDLLGLLLAPFAQASDAGNLLSRAVLIDGTDLTHVATDISCDLCNPSTTDVAIVAADGDANGDGYADGLAYRQHGNMATDDPFQIVLGSPSGLSTAGPVHSFGPVDPAAVLSTVIAAGDIDGNGTADVLHVSTRQDKTVVLQQWLDLANNGAITDVVLGRGTSTYAGFGVFTIGDANGDGADDLYAQSLHHVFYGSPTGYSPEHGTDIELVTGL